MLALGHPLVRVKTGAQHQEREQSEHEKLTGLQANGAAHRFTVVNAVEWLPVDSARLVNNIYLVGLLGWDGLKP